MVAQLETNVFRVVDALLAFDHAASVQELATLLRTDTIFAVFSGIMANLRKILYIQKFLSLGLRPAQISETLDVKPFLVEKSSKLLPRQMRLRELFSVLVKLDRDAKTGEIVSEGESGLELAFQKILLSF